MDPDATTHDALLTAAQRVVAAADDHDVMRLRHEAHELVKRLATHLAIEQPAVDGLPSFSRGLIQRGQQRLLAAALAIAETRATECQACGCADLARDLAAHLIVEANAERRVFSQAPVGRAG